MEKRSEARARMILLLCVIAFFVGFALFVWAENQAWQTDVTACDDTATKYEDCYTLAWFNDNLTDNVAAMVDKGGYIIVDISAPTGLTSTAVIEEVYFKLNHDGQSGISGAWGLTFEPQGGGTDYCTDNSIDHRSASQGWDVRATHSTCTWTKAELDDLQIIMASGDTAGGQEAYIYELDMNVTWNDVPSWSQNLNYTSRIVSIFQNATFNASGTDPDGDNMMLTVCLSDGISPGYPGTCTGSTACTSASGTEGLSCSYNMSDTAYEGVNTSFYGFLCDAGTQTCTSSTAVDIDVPMVYGTLWVNQTWPYNTSHNVPQFGLLDWNATLRCTGQPGAKCGTIDASALYNWTSPWPNTLINTTSGAMPMYITGSSPKSEIVCANLTNLADSYLNAENQGTNYGSLTAITLTSYYAGGSAYQNNRLVLKFGLDLNQSDIINYFINGTLYLYEYFDSNGIGRIADIYNMSNSWTEQAITWLNAPPHDVLGNSTIIPDAPSWVEFNITSIMSTAGNTSFLIRDSVENGSSLYTSSYNSKEQSSNNPYLTACYNKTIVGNNLNPKASTDILEFGGEWNVSWRLNFTAATQTTWVLNTFFNSTTYFGSVPTNYTQNVTVCIDSCPGLGGDSCTPSAGADWTITDKCEKNNFEWDMGSYVLYIKGGGSLYLEGTSDLAIGKLNISHEVGVKLNVSGASKFNVTGGA